MPPTPHPSGARPPQIPEELIPKHIAIVMDGNGRWAKERSLPRTAGHAMGEFALLDVVNGASSSGCMAVVYAFSTENWRRSPEEVRFLMGFNREVRRRRDELDQTGRAGALGWSPAAALEVGHQELRLPRSAPEQLDVEPGDVCQLRGSGRDRGCRCRAWPPMWPRGRIRPRTS